MSADSPLALSDFFPVWRRLEQETRSRLSEAAQPRTVPKGTLLHSGSSECTGLILVRTGRLRAYVASEDGREITLYRLLPRDICLFSAACMVSGLELDIALRAETEAEFLLIPAEAYRQAMQRSPVLAGFTNQLTSERFSSVVWLMNQVLWKRFDQRLAGFLLEERALADSDRLAITHEAIGSHLGTAREVVTRMLSYFRDEGLVRLSRGIVEIVNAEGLRAMAGD